MYGHFVEAGGLGSTEAAFARDQLVRITPGPNHERLQHAVVADAFGQGVKFVRIESLSRLIRVVLDFLDTQAIGRRIVGDRAAEKSIQTPPEPRLGRFHRITPAW
jgi:hypothetical protein